MRDIPQPARFAMSRREMLIVGSGALLALEIAMLAYGWWTGQWLVDEAGRARAYDFVNHWSAGRLALDGHAAGAYDHAVHGTMMDWALGRDVAEYFPWPYPAHAILLVMPFAAMPYFAGLAAWLAATGALYLAAARALTGSSAGMFAAFAFPASLWTIVVGQTGFLAAGLLGLALVLLPARPIWAGICIGLLTFKPQFGLLIPFALLAGGHWRAFASAAVTTIAFVALSIPVLGLEAWIAFAGSIATNGDVFFEQAKLPVEKLQTLFGIVLMLGGGERVAWLLQGALAAAMIAWVVLVWRTKASIWTKGAVLAVASVLATPYAFTYDMTLLAISLACLARGGFDRPDIWAGVAAAVIVLVSPALPFAGCFGAVLIVAATVARRCWPALRSSGPSRLAFGSATVS